MMKMKQEKGKKGLRTWLAQMGEHWSAERDVGQTNYLSL